MTTPFKPFFIHINPNQPGKMTNKHPRAATFKVSPCGNPDKVFVQFVLCSPKDEFCKATGRALSMTAEINEVNKRRLPGLLKDTHRLMSPDKNTKDYSYVLRNFI